MAEQRQDVVALIRRDFSNPTMVAQFKAALPEHVSVEKFQRVVLTAIQSSYQLVQADRVTLLKACMEAAADGLLPDGREGAIVPFRNGKTGRYEAQWQPMVWGLVKLVRNSGELKDIGVEIVRSMDKFERWIDEDGPHFKHTPSLDGQGDPIGVYAYARTKDGGFYIEYMAWSEIEKFKRLSKAKSADSPWNTWPEEMAKVRPIKRLCKRLPMSTDALAAFDRDDKRDARVMAGETVDPIAALNASIAGAEAPADAPPALENSPSPTARFNEFDARLREAQSVEQLDSILKEFQDTAGFSDDDVNEFKQMVAARREEFAPA